MLDFHLLSFPKRIDNFDLVIGDSVFNFGQVLLPVLDFNSLSGLLLEIIDDIISGVLGNLRCLFDRL